MKYKLQDVKDLFSFLKYLIFDYNREKGFYALNRHLRGESGDTYNRILQKFPRDYELEIEAKIMDERFQKRQKF